MTVESTTRKTTYAGGQADHTFTFKALTTAPEDIKCLKTLISTGAETDLTYAVDYTVDLEDDGIGGVVTLNPTCSTLYTVTVYRVTTDKQESDYDDYNQFPADTLETDLDRRTMISQERGEDSDRTLKLSISTSGVDTTLPTPVADQVLGWDSAGTAIENKDLTDLGTIVVDTDTTLAANSDDRVPSQKAIKDYAVRGNDGSVNPTNLLSNGDFESWSNGTSSAPDGWTAGGAGVAVARNDGAAYIKLGTYSLGMGRNGTNCSTYQNIETSKGIAYWKGRTVTFSCWVKCATADRARLALDDGPSETDSSYHTGGDTWQLLTLTHTVDSSATQIRLYCQINTADADAYFDGAICVEGESAFAFSPKPAEEGVWADYFASSTVEGWAAGKTGTIYTKKIGKTVFVRFAITGTSDQTYARFTMPYNQANTGDSYLGCCYTKDNNTATTTGGLMFISSSDNLINIFKDMAGAGFTNSGVKHVMGFLTYESA